MRLCSCAAVPLSLSILAAVRNDIAKRRYKETVHKLLPAMGILGYRDL